VPNMIELTPAELAEAQAQLAQRPERRPRQQSWLPIDFSANQGHGPPQRIIAVGSGKGGVGKSTVTANLAVLAAQRGLKVGVLDADLHGFSLTRILGITGAATRHPERPDRLVPPTVFGVKAISIGMFTDASNAVVWRGPVAHRALTQFLSDTDWGPLDLLLVDLPPGTGDVALSIANLLPTAELLLVTTPQAAAAEVAARAGAMAAHTHQRVIGVVENLAWLETPSGERVPIFGQGGGTAVAQQLTQKLGYSVELLGQIPLDPQLPTYADQGQPMVVAAPNSAASQAFQKLADRSGIGLPAVD